MTPDVISTSNLCHVPTCGHSTAVVFLLCLLVYTNVTIVSSSDVIIICYGYLVFKSSLISANTLS